MADELCDKRAMASPDGSGGDCWVLDARVDDSTLERIGDAREAADRLRKEVHVLIVGEVPEDPERLIHGGADHVWLARLKDVGQRSFVAAVADWLPSRRPRVVFAAGDAFGRESACRLGARCGWSLVSPALMVRARGERLTATALDSTGTGAREVEFGSDVTLIVTLRAGVAQPVAPDAARTGPIERLDFQPHAEAVVSRRFHAADPATADIRDIRRLVSGGRGLGSAAGFDLLRRVAAQLGAGVAASRAAVDLGWIEHARQVGQTGKTVKPDLYIACGISGASHHWEGMSESTHIVAINSDPDAPIHAKAHLGLAADLHEVLSRLEQGLSR